MKPARSQAGSSFEFRSIVNQDWVDSLRRSRGVANSASLQIKQAMSQPQAQPTPPTPQEVVEVMHQILVILEDAAIDNTIRGRMAKKAAREKINELRKRIV